MGGNAASALTENCDASRIPTERLDMALHPTQRQLLILKTKVTRYNGILGGQETLTGELKF